MLEGERTTTIAAPAVAVYAVLDDIEAYPEWHPFFTSVEVLEESDGRPVRVASTHAIPVGTLSTTLAISYEPGASVVAERIDGDLKALRASFAITEQDGATTVTHHVLVDPGMRMGLLLRGPVEDRVRDSVLGGGLAGLERRVTGDG